jgi:hypothetical protein
MIAGFLPPLAALRLSDSWRILSTPLRRMLVNQSKKITYMVI